MKLETARGTRDFLPQDKIRRNNIVKILQCVFERYGYNPLETPALERLDVLSSKYAGGAEILKEVYQLTDQGERKLALRYDLTVPFARVIAMNPQLKRPFKRYQIDRVWRDGPIKAGRYREFWQCDVDVVGIKSMMAEAELLALARDVFEELKMDVTITVNNRKILDGIFESCNVPENLRERAILSLDKLKKIGMEGVVEEMTAAGISSESVGMMKVLLSEKETDKLLVKLDETINNDGVKELREVLSYAEKMGVKNAVADVTLARGLSYYTGTIFEVFLNNHEITSSISAGGRYDRMVGDFLGSSEEVPAVGISFGLDVLSDALKDESSSHSVVKVYLIPIKTQEKGLEILANLRKEGINADMDLIGRSISKNLDYANKMDIPFVLIFGEDELREGSYTLKNMSTGEEKKLSFELLLKEVKYGL